MDQGNFGLQIGLSDTLMCYCQILSSDTHNFPTRFKLVKVILCLHNLDVTPLSKRSSVGCFLVRLTRTTTRTIAGARARAHAHPRDAGMQLPNKSKVPKRVLISSEEQFSSSTMTSRLRRHRDLAWWVTHRQQPPSIAGLRTLNSTTNASFFGLFISPTRRRQSRFVERTKRG